MYVGQVVSPPTDGISSLSFSSKANYLVASSWDNQVYICSSLALLFRGETLCCTQKWAKSFGIPAFKGHMESTIETLLASLKDPLKLRHANHHVFPI
jgi:WD40 repeat protein